MNVFPAVCDDLEKYYAPVPTAGVFDSPGVLLCLNTQWASFLDGALQPLLSPCQWAGSETEVEAAIQQVQRLLVALGNVGDCTSPIGVAAMYALIRDEKSQNVSGGTFTAGDWRQRNLTNVVSDTGGFVTLASNQITLPAGTYRCRIRCPAYQVSRHQARLYNVTDGSTLALGSSVRTAPTGGTQNESVIVGFFTLTSSKVLEIQHRCETTLANTGFGIAANFGIEVYTTAEFWKES